MLRFFHSRIFMLSCLLLLLIGLCLLADGTEAHFGLRQDYSFNGMTTHSDTTMKILSELKVPVHIYAVYTKGSEDTPLLELLNRYQSASDLITWEQVDVGLNPTLLTKFKTATSSSTQVTNDSVIVYCESTGRFRILDATDFYTLGYNLQEGVYEIAGLSYESSLTNAIRYVAEDEVPRVLVVQGQGELDEGGTALLTDLLRDNNYEVEFITIGSQELQLSSKDVLMILSPVRDFMDTELEVIWDFVNDGGSVFFTCDYTDPVESMPGYSALLRSFGFMPRDGIVIASEEETSSYYGDYRVFLLPVMQGTEITSDLIAGNSSTLLLAGSRAFETPEQTDRDLTVWTVLTSTARAYLRSLSGDLSNLDQQDGDAMGPFPLALQAERVTEKGNVSHAFILGCSTLLTSSEVYAMTDAQEFILRVMEYLAGQETTDLEIMAKQALRPSLRAGSVNGGKILAYLLPAAVLLCAILFLVPRYRKH